MVDAAAASRVHSIGLDTPFVWKVCGTFSPQIEFTLCRPSMGEDEDEGILNMVFVLLLLVEKRISFALLSKACASIHPLAHNPMEFN